MTLRIRLALIFIGLVLFTLIITTVLAWHELIEEPADPDTSADNLNESMSWRLSEIVLRGAGPIILLALIAWWLTQRLFRPIEVLIQATHKIQAGNYGEQIPLQGRRDELAQLTKAFNAMSLQVADSFRNIREFTLHANHELKTPLTLLRTSMERKLPLTGIGSPERDDLAAQLDEVHRLTKIVDSLALLTKADAQLLRWERLPVELDLLVQAAAEDADALADGSNLKVILETCPAITVTGDRFRLRQLLLILADNAVKYNQPDGYVRLRLEKQEDQAVITITNSGPGISPEQQGQVFDRFFRGVENQARSIDGSGLGLSIAQWIVKAHHGTITFQSNPVESTVTVTLPDH